MNRIKKILRLSIVEKKVFFEAVLTSLKIKILVAFFPMKWYAGNLGVQHSETTMDDGPENHLILVSVARAIIRTRKALPWHNRCLVEAITAKRMLARRGLKSTLYFGLSKEQQPMTAHAWLRCGSTIVTGGKGMQKFVVVNTFA